MSSSQSRLYSSSVGKKVTMGITGFIAFGFVVAHILGNLQIFGGPEKINNYAEFLHSLGSFLWIFRAVLLASVILHMVAAAQVTLQSLRARPIKYKAHRLKETTYAARTMKWGGPIIALFVVYHLLHFTFGSVHSDFTNNVYNNIVVGFQNTWVSLIYLAALLFLGLHLYHGVFSMFQSVGAAHPKWNVYRRVMAIVFALSITGAGASIPIAVLLGVIQLA